MNRKRLYRAIAIVGILATAVWLSLPTIAGRIVRSRAKDRGWTVEFRSLEWTRTSVRLHGVSASNAWMKAELDEVTLTVDGTQLQGVRADGGSVEADLSKRPKGESKGSLKTSADHLNVELRGLCGSGEAHIRGAGKDVEGTLWADKASGTCGSWVAETEGVRKTGTTITAGLMVLRKVGELPAESAREGSTAGDGFPSRLTVADLKVEADGRYVHALGATVDVNADGAEVEADSVAVELIAEVGPITATRVRAGIDRKTQQFTLGAATMNASMNAVSKDKLEALTIMTWGRIARKDGVTTVDDLLVKVGQFSLSGWLHYTDTKNFDAVGILSKTSCQTVIESAPKGFMDRMAGFSYSGTVASKLSVSGKQGKFSVQFDLENKCRVEKVPPEMDVKNFRKKFRRTVPGLKGDIEVESGPGSESWAPLDKVSPYMVKAVLTTEDTGFFVHHGFIPKSIENSLKENLEAGKFARGGSTVSMQLAKNLWLTRTKTISRKAQEFFLTTYLEQSMSKQDIMELYLNVVEFGPEIYGIRQASHVYFGKQPDDLTVGEAAFLASILPSPKREHFSKERTLTGGWDGYVKTIVRTMRTRDLISEQEAAEGLAETVTKGESITGGLSPVVLAPGGVDPRSWR